MRQAHPQPDPNDLSPADVVNQHFQGHPPVAGSFGRAMAEYAPSFVLCGIAGSALLFVILLLQPLVPWNNHAYLSTPITPDLAFNLAFSFSTTTTWQPYGGETTMSYISQIVGLSAQSFIAGATGLAIGIAFIRGFARQSTTALGNFWVDLVRAMLWVILPSSLVGGLVLVWQGVPMNWNPYTVVHTVDGGRGHHPFHSDLFGTRYLQVIDLVTHLAGHAEYVNMCWIPLERDQK